MTTNLSAKDRLLGKTAIVTGASKGIGRGVADLFAEEGAHVVLVSRTEADLQKAVQSITDRGGKASYVVADVTKPQDMEKVAEDTLKAHGRIDILVHNAGIYPVAPLLEMSVSDWNHVINTNLNSTFYAVKACLPAMERQNYGRIVLTSSISGPTVGWPGGSHYTASKAGMNGFMKTAAIELAPHHITINAVEPGNVISEGFDELGEAHKQKITSAIPMGRLATAREIAQGHLFLASDEARYMTGQSLIMDGGQVLPESDQMMRESIGIR